jgi:hypothetical protein
MKRGHDPASTQAHSGEIQYGCHIHHIDSGSPPKSKVYFPYPFQIMHPISAKINGHVSHES